MHLFLEFPAWLTPQIAPWLPIRWYGLLYIVAFVVTMVLFGHEAKRSGLSDDRDELAVFFTWAIGGALAGARLLYVVAIGPTPEYLAEPWRIVWPFAAGEFTGLQGMSYHGGLLGAAVATALFCKSRKQAVLQWADTLAVSAPLGYAAGRIGNFINGELIGRVTEAPWAVLFPHARRVPIEEPWARRIATGFDMEFHAHEALVNLPRHPAQLYGALLEGVLLWLVLWFGFRTRRMFPGALVGLYVVGYGVARFVVGYFRGVASTDFALVIGMLPESHHAMGALGALSVDQLVALAMIALGVAILGVARVIRPTPSTISTYTE
jgi:phosphatidylglycerol---prolipoprotein diacylglyceryl transferase